MVIILLKKACQLVFQHCTANLWT